MSARFTGRVALVVGGNGGMGAAVCASLRDEGARVLVGDLPFEGAANDPSQIALDVRDPASVVAMFDEVERRAGHVDVVVFLAGAFEAKRFLDTDDATFERLYAVNVLGAARVLREAGKRMEARRSGSIVVVASQSARVVRLHQAAYGSSKAALAYLTKAAGLELAASGVRCNLVMPGVTETPMARAVWDRGQGSAEAHVAGDLARFRAPIPLQRVAQPADVAAAVLFLASDDARHLTMTEIVVDGGSSLIA